MNIWKILNIINIIAIIAVIVYSKEVTFYLNEYTDYLNALHSDSDGLHIVRWIMNKWQGIALSGVLGLFFFMRYVMRGISKIFN